MAVGPWHASVPPLWGHARIGSGPWALRRDESWINDVTETGREAGEAPTRPPKRLWRRSAASDAGVPAGNAMKNDRKRAKTSGHSIGVFWRYGRFGMQQQLLDAGGADPGSRHPRRPSLPMPAVC
ncbi:hypothetical protein VTN96DRAFT_5025 [Rasamsonia emersonii]